MLCKIDADMIEDYMPNRHMQISRWDSIRNDYIASKIDMFKDYVFAYRYSAMSNQEFEFRLLMQQIAEQTKEYDATSNIS